MRPLPSPPRAVAALRDASVRLRPGFLASFTILGALLVVGLAYAVSSMMAADIREQQIAAARQRAEVLAQSGFAPPLRRQLHRRAARQLRALDEAAVAAQRAGGTASLAVWDRSSRIVYSTDHRQIGQVYRAPEAVDRALRGRTVTAVEADPTSPADRADGERIHVAVPLYRQGRRGRPFAAFELHVPYAAVAAEITRRTRRVNLVLGGAALLFLAAIWPRLRQASRALRSQSDPATRLLLRELERGMQRGELVLEYLPKIDLRTGEVRSVEALIRWNHPRHGRLAPGQFLPQAADSDLIGPLTLHLIDLALRDCNAWRARGLDAGVDVNLSAANVLDRQLPDAVEHLLDRWSLPPGALGFELTEAAIAADAERAQAVLRDLAGRGMRLAIDDFGTGYSSLSVLRELPIRELKIDRSFTGGLTTSPADETIVRSTIGLAHDFGVTVVAEGVEDEHTLDRLAELGCDHAQGYWFSRPLALDDLMAWFEEPVLAGPAPAVPA